MEWGVLIPDLAFKGLMLEYAANIHLVSPQRHRLVSRSSKLEIGAPKPEVDSNPQSRRIPALAGALLALRFQSARVIPSARVCRSALLRGLVGVGDARAVWLIGTHERENGDAVLIV